mmetsp:Transcript_73799/g.116395  ORF Transcript_73799/g.116395 Transcript_73799/m.116395 type:complete len:85 (+) Transcript_73799:758-1012(+)
MASFPELEETADIRPLSPTDDKDWRGKEETDGLIGLASAEELISTVPLRRLGSSGNFWPKSGARNSNCCLARKSWAHFHRVRPA